MPTYVRWKDTGTTYFFTLVIHRRRPWFADAEHRLLLGHAFRETRRRFPFEVDAIVLLPDHLHVVMCPADGVDYSDLWRLVKTTCTRRVVAGLRNNDPALGGRRRGERSVWQRRFVEHTIRDEEDWRRHVDYIHLNPVKHGFVENPRDWPWSSIHRFIRKGWLDPAWPGGSPVQLPAIEE